MSTGGGEGDKGPHWLEDLITGWGPVASCVYGRRITSLGAFFQMVPTVYKAVNQGKQGSGCSLTSADTGGQQVDKSGATDIYEGACRAHQRRGFLCARRPGPLPVQDFAAFQCANGTFWVFPESLSLSPLTGRKLLFVRHNEFCLNLEITMKSLDYEQRGYQKLREESLGILELEKNGHNSRIWLVSTCGNSPEVKRCDVPIPASSLNVVFFFCEKGKKKKRERKRGPDEHGEEKLAGEHSCVGVQGAVALDAEKKAPNTAEIRLKRDSCNDFQMLASSLLADRGGCGRLRDGNQKPGQMYHVSVSSAHIWLQYRQR
ncbi:hypothetical protein MG293_020255 [Ovis ammon polii]|uniref:Uncharacterized protein n=1 Tax=Ovis ammon polii TaxID=230172 RepID=A0AAD4TK54_OVIAM|nr:hypothetical protein MG293_020255 [Ovis ammon polii]